MKQADFIINFAAETHVDRSIHNGTDRFIKSNILGVHSLLKALRASPNIKKMIHISTDEVWEGLPFNSKKQFNEESPFLPNSPYAASNAAGDLLVRAHVRTYGLPVMTTHSVNNFGSRQFPEKLIPFFVLRALVGKKLPLYGDGRNIRDWIYVDDHSQALLTILERGLVGDDYAISGNEEHQNIEIAKRILRVLKRPSSLITFVADRPGHDRRYSVNSSKLRALGWKPRQTFNSALIKTVQWYVKNQKQFSNLVFTQNINTHIKIT